MGSRRLRMLDKRMRKLFVSKGEKVTGDRRKLRKEFLILLLAKCYSGEQMKEKRWAENVSRMGTGEMGAEFWSGNLKEDATSKSWA
jgi:hypothetical protein